jgi:hypothetical protein
MNGSEMRRRNVLAKAAVLTTLVMALSAAGLTLAAPASAAADCDATTYAETKIET